MLAGTDDDDASRVGSSAHSSSRGRVRIVVSSHRRRPIPGRRCRAQESTWMTSAESDVSELGGLPGAPPPPLGPPLEVPKMAPGDVVLLEMNGEKWAFINMKRGQCVPARSSRRHVSNGNRESVARRVAAAAARETRSAPRSRRFPRRRRGVSRVSLPRD